MLEAIDNASKSKLQQPEREQDKNRQAEEENGGRKAMEGEKKQPRRRSSSLHDEHFSLATKDN